MTKAILLIMAILSPFVCSSLSAQPGFNRGDIITYADSRDVTGVELTPQEAIFYTGGGLWRFNRTSGEPLEPEYCGVVSGSIVHLDKVSALLFHRESASLWVSTDDGLFIQQTGSDVWRDMGAIYSRATRLGEKNDTLYVQMDSEIYGIAVFGFRDLGLINAEVDDSIRWSVGEGYPTNNQNLPFYFSLDPFLRFDPDKGRLIDWDLTSYRFSFYIIDEEFGKRYIAFPGLGFGIADDRRGALDIFQPGPAGRGVKSIAFGENGVVFLGGIGNHSGDGLNTFDRMTRKWDRPGRRQRFGLETNSVNDIVLLGDRLYAATESGLLTGVISQDNWSIKRFLDGTPEPPLSMLEIIGERLFVGGRDGMKQMILPRGPFIAVSGTDKSELVAFDGAVDGDTLWVVSEQGFARSSEKGDFEFIKGDNLFSDSQAKAITITSSKIAVGGTNGLGIFDRKNRLWTSMSSAVYFKNGQVISLASRKNEFYIGTDRGLFYYNVKTGALLPFGLDMGLPDSYCEELTIEADTLWVGTRAGLTKINLNAAYWK